MKRVYPKRVNARAKKPRIPAAAHHPSACSSRPELLDTLTNKENSNMITKTESASQNLDHYFICAAQNKKPLQCLARNSESFMKTPRARASPEQETNSLIKRHSLVDLREPSGEALSRASQSITKEQQRKRESSVSSFSDNSKVLYRRSDFARDTASFRRESSFFESEFFNVDEFNEQERSSGVICQHIMVNRLSRMIMGAPAATPGRPKEPPFALSRAHRKNQKRSGS